MARRILYGALLAGLAITAGALVGSRRASPPVSVDLHRRATGPTEPRVTPGRDPGPDVGRQLERLAATLAAEANQRQRLEERLELLAVELAELRAAVDGGGATTESEASPPPPDAAAVNPEAAAAESAGTAIERALLAAGVDAATAADIKRRRDELALSELYLRDQAEREQWLNTPRFREEMAELERQRTSIRDEIGDEAYDRYLAAAGEPNRVGVDEVLSDSAAAQAGLLSGDVVLRYGGVRIFAPDELVAETRAGRAGETVRVEVLRNGERVEILVPRGPLGLRIASRHGSPEGS